MFARKEFCWVTLSRCCVTIVTIQSFRQSLQTRPLSQRYLLQTWALDSILWQRFWNFCGHDKMLFLMNLIMIMIHALKKTKECSPLIINTHSYKKEHKIELSQAINNKNIFTKRHVWCGHINIALHCSNVIHNAAFVFLTKNLHYSQWLFFIRTIKSRCIFLLHPFMALLKRCRQINVLFLVSITGMLSHTCLWEKWLWALCSKITNQFICNVQPSL